MLVNAVQTGFPSFDRHLIPLGRRVGQGKGLATAGDESSWVGGAQAGICMWLVRGTATILIFPCVPVPRPPQAGAYYPAQGVQQFPTGVAPTPVLMNQPPPIAPKRERKTVSSSRGL